MSKIENRYFRKLMNDAITYRCKWSINEVFEYKPLLDIFYSKVMSNRKVFYEDNLLRNIETALRIGGSGIATKVANFPIATCDEVLARYNVNNNWYDMSCGWGARLTSALKNKVNYFGTDPNYKLVEKLLEFKNDWEVITHTQTQCDIRCQGSEVFVPEWVNKMGLCFTSPPYFNLEDYKYGEQSYKEGTSYEMWLSQFLEPTIQNCYKYLIDSGYMAINIKNFNGLKLEEDTIMLAEKNGFVYIEDFELKNISRVNKDGLINSNERIMIFMKKGFEHLHDKYRVPEQIDMFSFLDE